MWRFFDRLVTVLALVAATAPVAHGAPPPVSGIEDRTTTHRALLKGALPAYPSEELGRWTQSCVSIYFTVRRDGKTDQFVVLESSRPQIEKKLDTLSRNQQIMESREMWRFVEPSLKAALRWEYAPASQASDEIAVFLFERSEMGAAS